MTEKNKTVLVTGATGQQGGAVATRLLRDGWAVRAITRDPGSPAAKALADAGAEVRQADLDDYAAVADLTQGAYGVFSVQAGPLAPDQDEERAGRNLADAAKAHGVAHLVYSSANSADRTAEIGLQQPKWAIERHIRDLGVSATILRPTSFMENLLHPLIGIRDGALTSAAAPDLRQQYIALEDIAALAALAFARPAEFRGTLELAGDALTPAQVVAAIGRATGRELRYHRLPLETLRRQSETAARGYEFMNSGRATQADIEALRRLHPGLLDFDTWLARTGAARIAELLV
ncbi:NmrA family NAD(P)-binding protein [Amycolatopsis nigrescens]|uniref:NmrA family NAD(P)-binding protein n=1 Tax=Amycolatopsis nigrescens TaxID=381445 RepID=UPI00037DCD54|nr:NmrA family NAD(P)-binding protein [Amycolatopsis nigrescens]